MHIARYFACYFRPLFIVAFFFGQASGGLILNVFCSRDREKYVWRSGCCMLKWMIFFNIGSTAIVAHHTSRVRFSFKISAPIWCPYDTSSMLCTRDMYSTSDTHTHPKHTHTPTLHYEFVYGHVCGMRRKMCAALKAIAMFLALFVAISAVCTQYTHILTYVRIGTLALTLIDLVFTVKPGQENIPLCTVFYWVQVKY